uniref:Putative ovule protein n=1 Tax=Solanum chacoense TaxID=4108 RepID=A0A0V0HIS9_SOLCH
MPYGTNWMGSPMRICFLLSNEFHFQIKIPFFSLVEVVIKEYSSNSFYSLNFLERLLSANSFLSGCK